MQISQLTTIETQQSTFIYQKDSGDKNDVTNHPFIDSPASNYLYSSLA